MGFVSRDGTVHNPIRASGARLHHRAYRPAAVRRAADAVGRHSVVQPGAISACRWRIRRAGGTSRNTRDATIEMKPQPQTSSQEVLAGLIERVTYHNAENGFCVLRAKARGHRDVVTVVGHAAAIAAGEWITASGEWVNDRTHGQQFKARFLRTSPPTSADGIEKYLSSGMIRGVGPVYAKFLPDKRTSFLPNRHCCN